MNLRTLETIGVAGVVLGCLIAACGPVERTPPEVAPPATLGTIRMEYALDQYGYVCYAKEVGYNYPPIVVSMASCIRAGSEQ